MKKKSYRELKAERWAYAAEKEAEALEDWMAAIKGREQIDAELARLRRSQRGSKHSKIPAVMEAVKHADQMSHNKSALSLWEYLKRKYHGE